MILGACKKYFGENSAAAASCCCIVFFTLALLSKWLEPVLSRDGVLYLEMVRCWKDSGSYEAILAAIPDVVKIPALPLFLIKILVDCGISPEIAGLGISMFSGSTLPLLVYLMAQEIQSDKRVSLAASILMAFNPPMIELACEVQRDMIYIVFCGWSIFFALKGLLRKLVWPWLPAGILGACAMLTRYETFEMIPILFLAFLIFGLKKVIPGKKICQQAAVYFIACAATVVGMVYIMGVQDYIVDTYPKHVFERLSVLEQSIPFVEKK